MQLVDVDVDHGDDRRINGDTDHAQAQAHANAHAHAHAHAHARQTAELLYLASDRDRPKPIKNSQQFFKLFIQQLLTASNRMAILKLLLTLRC